MVVLVRGPLVVGEGAWRFVHGLMVRWGWMGVEWEGVWGVVLWWVLVVEITRVWRGGRLMVMRWV